MLSGAGKSTGSKKQSKVSLDDWFDDRRQELSGICQCGCGKPSSKDSDQYYKYSIAHIFPKAIFKSIATHPVNYVERAFWGGCHTIMDTKGIDYWPNMADWATIKERILILLPLVDKKERTHKLYAIIEQTAIMN